MVSLDARDTLQNLCHANKKNEYCFAVITLKFVIVIENHN